MEISQRTDLNVFDGGRFTLSDIRIQATSRIWYRASENTFTSEMVSLPEANILLTVKEAEQLIEQLTIALKLVGKDFIVHESMALTVGELEEYNSETYDNYEDYLAGKVSE